MIFEMALSKSTDANVVYFERSMIETACCLGCFDLVKPSQIDAKNIDSLFFIQWRIIEADVNSRFESLIDGADTIGGQEEDAIIVFKDSKEDLGGLL